MKVHGSTIITHFSYHTHISHEHTSAYRTYWTSAHMTVLSSGLYASQTRGRGCAWFVSRQKALIILERHWNVLKCCSSPIKCKWEVLFPILLSDPPVHHVMVISGVGARSNGGSLEHQHCSKSSVCHHFRPYMLPLTLQK